MSLPGEVYLFVHKPGTVLAEYQLQRLERAEKMDIAACQRHQGGVIHSNGRSSPDTSEKFLLRRFENSFRMVQNGIIFKKGRLLS